MPVLDIDQDVYDYLLSRAVKIGEDGSSILRREFGIAEEGIGGSGKIGLTDEADSKADLAELDRFLAGPEMRFGTATKKYLQLLGFLATIHGEGFDKVLEFSGRHRRYFARSREEIAESGSSTHPQRIPGTDFWALTNIDTRDKQHHVVRVMATLGYPEGASRQAAKAVR